MTNEHNRSDNWQQSRNQMAWEEFEFGRSCRCTPSANGGKNEVDDLGLFP
jgi:hypothetical protein